MSLPRLDAVGSLLEQVVGEIAECPSRRNLLADGRHLRVQRVPPSTTPPLEAVATSVQGGVCAVLSSSSLKMISTVQEGGFIVVSLFAQAHLHRVCF